MLKLSFWRTMPALFLALVLTACGGGAGSSASAPGGFTVTPGNDQAIITFTSSPGVQYWLMYAPTATAIDMKNPPGNHAWATNITSPYVISGLTNGVTYSFAINGRTSGGPGGVQSVSLSVVPKAAGATWTPGATALGTADMRGVAYGTASDSTVNYLAVGSGGALYKGPEGVSQSLTGMVWSKVAQATAVDFRAATYTLSKYIAVGAATGGSVSNVFYSTDMATWNAATTPGNTALNALASNGTTVVAVGDGGKVFYSTDAVTWSAANALPAAVTPNLYGVAYSAGTASWAAVGAGGVLFTSTDAINWTAGTSGTGINDLRSVTATSTGVFVAVGDGGTVATGTAASAVSGWTVQTLVGNLYAVSTDSVQFVTVGQGGKVYTSVDGNNWNAATSTNTTDDLFSVVGSASKYIAVGQNGSNISSIN